MDSGTAHAIAGRMLRSPTNWILVASLIYTLALVIPIGWERIWNRHARLRKLRSAYDDAVHEMLKDPSDPAARARALKRASAYYDAALSRYGSSDPIRDRDGTIGRARDSRLPGSTA